MKDSEIRGLILQYYYDRLREGFTLQKPEELGHGLTELDILQVADQLGEHNLIEWKKLGSHGEVRVGLGKINAFGIDVVEGETSSELKMEFVQNKTINISGSTNVVVGDNNTVTQSVQDLVNAINSTSGTPEQKAEEKIYSVNFLSIPCSLPLLVARLDSLANAWPNKQIHPTGVDPL